ncbi:MAG: hypothetical protein GDA56_27570 [Hormoscilla sp. GM7CHS1pb]|nr:hypothetical protein [Hormoscilla sp. GM7CHS1pb]
MRKFKFIGKVSSLAFEYEQAIAPHSPQMRSPTAARRFQTAVLRSPVLSGHPDRLVRRNGCRLRRNGSGLCTPIAQHSENITTCGERIRSARSASRTAKPITLLNLLTRPGDPSAVPYLSIAHDDASLETGFLWGKCRYLG